MSINGQDGALGVLARANGRDGYFIVDTGADSTVISSKWLAVADRTGQRLDELCLGDFCVEDEAVFAWETPFSSTAENEPRGFIGMSLLRHLTLRFEKGTTLVVGDGIDGCSGREVPFSLTDAGTPIAEASVDGIDIGRIALDTGATRSVLDQASVNMLASYVTARATPTGSCTVNGCSEAGANLSRVEQWCVGDRCADHVEVKFPIWNAVGANWFARFDVRFDFRKNALVFCD